MIARRLAYSEFLRQLGTTGLAALVLLLAVLAVSPGAHAGLHHDSDHADHSCAIVLFAHGITDALEVATVPLPAQCWAELTVYSPDEVLLLPPRYLRRPERGPPLC